MIFFIFFSLSLVVWCEKKLSSMVKVFGGDVHDNGYGVLELSDGYILYGSTSSYGSGSSDLAANKISLEGELEWSKVYGTVDNELLYYADPTSDGGFIGSGTITTFKLLVAKFDSNGDLENAKTLGNGINHGEMVFETSDGGYFVSSRRYPSGDNLRFFKLDADLNSTWSTEINMLAGNVNQASSLEASDGSYYFVTSCYYSYYEIVIGKLNSTSGAVLWLKSFRITSGHVYTYSVSQSHEGNLIIGVTTTNIGLTSLGDGVKMGIVKFTSRGEYVFDTFVGLNDKSTYLDDLVVVGSGSNEVYVVSGTTQTTTSSEYHQYVATFNTRGDLLSMNVHDGFTNGGYLKNVRASSDGGLIAGGYGDSGGFLPGNNFVFMKLKSDGTGCEMRELTHVFIEDSRGYGTTTDRFSEVTFDYTLEISSPFALVQQSFSPSEKDYCYHLVDKNDDCNVCDECHTL